MEGSCWPVQAIDDLKAQSSGAIAIGPFGSRMKSDCYVTSGVPVIRGNNISDTRTLTGEMVYITPEKTDELRSSIVYADDLVFPHRGAIGQVGIVPQNAADRYILSSSLMKLTCDRTLIEPLFLFYFFRSAPGRHELLANTSSVGTPGIGQPLSTLKAIRVPVPPLPEQQAIAHILGTLDDKIELNRRMNETLEEMARAIFKSWFVDFDPVCAKAAGQKPVGLASHIADLFPDSFEDSELGEIPKGWKVKTLAEVSEKPQYGYTASASHDPIGPRFLRITDINKHQWIEWQHVPFCPIQERDRGKYLLEKGDVVIARMADPGHGAMIEESIDAVFASYLIRFRPSQPEMGRFLQYWLRADSYWRLVGARQSGTTRANLNAQVLGAFSLVVPDPTVLQAFSAQVSVLRDKLVAQVRESCTLAALRDALLPKLISGEIRVKDAENLVKEVS